MFACSRMSAALVHSTCADNRFALDAAFVRSTCFQCSKLRISRFTGPYIRTNYADTVEHARLFKSISSVQRYSLQRSMRANMRRHVHIVTYEQFKPTPLSMLDCLKVYRVFKGTRCSVRCVVLSEGPFVYRASQGRLIVR